MGREKSHEDETEIDYVDRGIHTFSQLNLNCMLNIPYLFNVYFSPKWAFDKAHVESQ